MGGGRGGGPWSGELTGTDAEPGLVSPPPGDIVVPA